MKSRGECIVMPEYVYYARFIGRLGSVGNIFTCTVPILVPFLTITRSP